MQSRATEPGRSEAVPEQTKRSGLAGMWRRWLAIEWPISLAFVLCILLLWQLASLSGPKYLVGPYEILQAVVQERLLLLLATGSSALRLITGFAIGAALGIALGLAAGVNRMIRDLSGPIVSTTYPLPKIALFPAIAVVLGYTDTSRILIIALAAFYPVYLNSFSAGRSVDPRLVQVGMNTGVGRWRIFRSIIVPAATPRIFVGLRIGLAAAFVLLYVGEALGGMGQGLGFRVSFISLTDDYPQLYAAILCFAVLGILGDRVLGLLERRLTRGQKLEVVGDA